MAYFDIVPTIEGKYNVLSKETGVIACFETATDAIVYRNILNREMRWELDPPHLAVVFRTKKTDAA